MLSRGGLYYTLQEGPPDRPPLVLLHGAGADHLIWPAQLRRLPGQRVIALDLPGHGRSKGIALQRVDALAGRILAFLDELELHQATLVGHALGGAVALSIAVNAPDRVSALGLVASGAHLPVDRALMDPLASPQLAALAVHTYLERAFSPTASPALVAGARRMLQRCRPSVLLADWQACASFDLRAEIYRVTAPVWVACGDADRIVPVSCAHFLTAQLPQARLQRVSGAGHMLPLEQPEVLAEGLSRFLEDASERYLRLELQVLHERNRVRRA